MASNPPFQMEDQTDEDFFDKLVDDDDDFKVTAPTLNSFADGSDSDEAKAFANLSIGDVDTSVQDSGGSEGLTEGKGDTLLENVNAISTDGNVEESSTIQTSNSFQLDSVIEPSNTELGTEVNSHSMISKSSGSPSSVVKEVQWAAFNTDLRQDGGNGFGSYSDFFSELGDSAAGQPGKVEDHFSSESKIGSGSEELKTSYDENNFNSFQYEGSIATEAVLGQSADGQVVNNVQYWENQYPGWKFDVNTGQWYQVDGYDPAGNVQGSSGTYQAGEWAVLDGNSQIPYSQQAAQSFVGTVTDSGTTESVTKWNQSSHDSGMIESVSNWNQVSLQRDGSESVSNWDQISTVNNGYPAHMVFEPQYPGWYYDTIAQEWRSLEFYTSSIQSSIEAHDQPNQNIFGSAGSLSHENGEKHFGDYGHVDNYGSQGIGVQNQGSNWAESYSNYNKQSSNTWQPENVVRSEASENFSGNRQLTCDYGSKFSVTSHVSQQKSYENVAQSEASRDFSGNQQLTYGHGSNFSVTNQESQQKSYDSSDTVPFYENVAQSHNDFSRTGSQGFVPTMSFHQPVNQPFVHQNEQMKASNDYYGNENSLNPTLPQFQNGHQFSYAPTAGRSSADRPPHALVTFGFGGKLIFMKNNSYSSSSSYGSQGSLGGTISVVNMMEVVTEVSDPSSIGAGASDYISTLCGRSFPGPLVGGNVGSKELNKWIDEKVASCNSPNEDYRKGEVLRLLFSLLKIACQYYGKLRSPFGSEAALRESDAPESAVARLFVSAKRNAVECNNYNTLGHSLHKLPSEEQMRATAAEVQRLLVSGKKKEALHFASEGQLWGPALVLAAQLGDQFYSDTVKQMAFRQLVAGSPLRTLCLLIAGQPADVFSTDPSANMFSQPTQYGIISMLDYWEENLAVITANRTKDDELVLIHLGDCLWKDRSEIIAAHICYLVAEANFEPYSDSARLCLVGADHLKHPRTFASPEAIQRTELYEYSKVLGNPQFILLPFQPYKLIYAHMLAEVGKVTESLKYCQAVLKSLKTGRAPEVDTLRQLVSSLEERLRTHQQGGYSSTLAPAKIVGKLLNLFDSTAHRVVGGLPPPIPSTSQSSAQVNEQYYHQPMGYKVSTSQSTTAMSSLMPSASMEPISEWTAEGNRKTMHSRSVSEPDFGRTPRQDDSSKEVTSSTAQGKALVSGGTSRFGRFGLGSQLLQKTVGLVLKPRQDRQAKLGEKNRFYYDEKLKRWVEEGAELPAEEAAPPPPPTIAAFQNGMSDYYLTSAVKSEGSLSNGSPEFRSPTSSELSSGIPPIPTATNQFSARGRMGVRSRYVDTFNKGGGNPANLFQSPAVPSIKPATGSNPKFFVPSPVSSREHSHETTTDIVQEATSVSETSSIPTLNNSLHSPLHSVTMQRFPSMDNISTRGKKTNGSGSISSHSRRTASWSGSLNNASSLPKRTEVKPLGEVLGMSPSSFVPNEPSVVPLTKNSGSFGEDLHEVEL